MAEILDWLFQHANEVHRPTVWANILGVTILDWDGWAYNRVDRKDMEEEVGLPEFIRRLSNSTIHAPR